MTPLLGRALIIAFVGVGSIVRAEPPRISSISPAGVRRGVTTEVVVAGGNLAGSPKWLPSFEAQVAAVGPASDGKTWKIKITPDADVSVGVYLVRVVTEGGLSNAFPFAIDQVPHVGEAEDNSSFALAQKVDTPVIVEGQASGTDVDYFRFSGRQGEKVVIDAVCARVGSGVDPSIRLSTLNRRFVAAADDTPGLITDARLFAELPVDGDYVVELSDTRYQGAGPRTNYRLLIGRGVPAAALMFPLGGRRGSAVRLELAGGTLAGSTPRRADVTLGGALEVEPGRLIPRITEATIGVIDPLPSGGWWLRDVEALPPLAVGDAPEHREPSDPAAPPTRAALPAVFNGRIEAPHDADFFVVTGVTPGQKVRVALEAAALGSLLDGVLQVQGVNGAVLASNDDSAIPARARPKLPAANPNAAKKPAILSMDPEVVVTVPAATTEITVSVRDLEADGGSAYPYRLTVEPVVPGFAVLIGAPDPINIPRGGTMGVAVEVERRDFNGPITLNIAEVPPGVTVRPGLIPAGQSVGSLTFSAGPEVAFDPTTLRITGEAVGPAGLIVAEGTRTTILAQQADFATGVVTQVGVPAAPASPAPITLTGPDAPVEVVLAYPATFPVRAVRLPGAEDVVLTFGSLPTIPNLTIAADPKLAARAGEGTITVTTTPDLPPGPVVVTFTARGKLGDRERTIALPAVTLNVVRPADLELITPRVELVAGGSAEVNGKVVRRGACRDPVTVKLDGLPAGVKADPVVVPPEATDFALKVVADAKAAPIEATARVTSTLKLGPKDFATPPIPLAIKVVPAP